MGYIATTDEKGWPIIKEAPAGGTFEAAKGDFDIISKQVINSMELRIKAVAKAQDFAQYQAEMIEPAI